MYFILIFDALTLPLDITITVTDKNCVRFMQIHWSDCAEGKFVTKMDIEMHVETIGRNDQTTESNAQIAGGTQWVKLHQGGNEQVLFGIGMLL